MKNNLKKLFIILSVLLSSTLFAERIDPVTGLIIDKGLNDIKENCTVCHPGRFMVVNGGDKKFWKYKINLMQKGFGLWEIDKQKLERMLNYLAKNYSKKTDVSINQ